MEMHILMATYNGAAFLKQQLDSVCALEGEWRLTIRDDCSTDATVEIISSYCEKFNNISIVTNEQGNLGACGNFNELLIAAEQAAYGQYFMLADQDDVWQSDKLKRQLALMKEIESERPGCPVLIHSGLEVVDQNLKLIDPSFMHYQGLRHEAHDPLRVLLAQNYITGCTVLVNRPLLELALPVPKDALMHDWWLALCAAACGEIGFIDRPLVKYRQHALNEVGAKSLLTFLNPFKTNWISRWFEGRDSLEQSIHQAQVLAKRIKKYEPGNENLKLIESYGALLSLPRWQRIEVLNKKDIHCQSRLRHYLNISRLLTLPRQADE